LGELEWKTSKFVTLVCSLKYEQQEIALKAVERKVLKFQHNTSKWEKHHEKLQKQLGEY